MTRLSRALNRSHLEHSEQDCDVDVLQAAGMTAIRKGLGVLIMEAKEGAAGDGADCRGGLERASREVTLSSLYPLWGNALLSLSLSRLSRDCHRDRCDRWTGLVT